MVRPLRRRVGLSFKQLGIAAVLTLTLTATMVAVTPHTAEAQTQVESTVKGTIGLGMVGAELGFVLPAAFGMEAWWGYVLFPVIGAAAGAVGGYFAFDSPQIVEGSVASLVAGMALMIPALVLTLVLTAYDPSDEGIVEGEDEGQGVEEIDGEVDEGADFDVDAESTDVGARLDRAGSGLVRVASGAVGLGVPGLAVLPTASPSEIALYGATEDTEVRLSLVSGTF
jgi:hypothetical protein